jgi:hypothetical protein
MIIIFIPFADYVLIMTVSTYFCKDLWNVNKYNTIGLCLRTPALSLEILLPSARVFLLFIYAG